MKKTILSLLTIFAIAIASVAQSPVRWRMSVTMTSPNEGEIIITALISEGWHLYGLSMPQGGPKATQFNFSNSSGIELNGDIKPSHEPIVKMDPLFGKELSWWDRNVNFTQRFSVSNKQDGNINVQIFFMCCNSGTCTPPRIETISTSIPQYDPSRLTPKKR